MNKIASSPEFYKLIMEETKKHLGPLIKSGAKNVNITDEFSKLTFNLIIQILIGIDVSQETVLYDKTDGTTEQMLFSKAVN